MKASPSPDPVPSDPPATSVESVSPAEVPTAPHPMPQEPPKPATWPEWFGAVDFALVVMVVVVGFLAASFPARNSDLWFQLANGRNLVEGKYTPGADPYSHTGADRAWVDTSWLNDLGQYALYKMDQNGAALVAAKASVFAAAFALLFALRRSGQALWPWAVLIALAVLSSAPSAAVRPIVWSMLFLSATLLILYRWPWLPGSWRQPLLLAGLFAVWANVDAWFFLGPLTVAMVLVGEKLHPLLTREREPLADDPFPAAPPTGLLGRALLVGTLACLLNPMLLAAVVKEPGAAFAQLLPVEFGVGIPAGAASDGELRGLTQQPFFPDDYFVFQRGTPDEQLKLPSLAFAAFTLFTAVALVAGFARLRATHILLWVVFAALALLHVRLVPFFAIVAAPLAAAHVNGLSARIKLGPLSDTQTRLTLTGSALGRLLTVAASLLLIGAAYPGWLHSPAPDPAYANRLEWVIAPDAGMVRSAKLMTGIRSDLPEAIHGLNLSAEFGNYCAWYAPGERVFLNGRFAFHRPELADFLTVRSALIGRRPPNDVPETDEAARVCDARKAGFLTYAARSRLDSGAVGAMLQDEDRWDLWHLDGRFMVFGRTTTVNRDEASQLRYDPVRLAFGAEQPPLPEGKSLQPLRTAEDPWDAFLNDYLTRSEPLPPEADDVEMLDGYNNYLGIRSAQRWAPKARLATSGSAAAAAGVLAGAGWIQANPQPVEGARLALPVLLTRLSRQAIAANPDRPNVYRALSTAYSQQYTPTTSLPLEVVQMPEQQLQIHTALVRYLARVPPPEQCTPAMKRESFRAAMRLSEFYRQTGQLDLCREVFGRMVRLAEMLPPEEFREFIQPGPKMDESLKAFLKGLKEEEDTLARLVQQHTLFVERQTTPTARFWSAVNDLPSGRQQGGLPGKAIEVFKSASGPGEFGTGDAQLQVVLQLITLELRAGRLEDAAADLAALDDEIKRLAATQPNSPVTAAFRSLQGVKARLEGNFAAAAEAMLRAPGSIDPLFVGTTLSLPAGYVRLDPQVSTILGVMVGSPSGLHTVSYVVHQVLGQESAYQYDRAMLAISDGNIPEARRRLEQAAKPQGIDLTRIGSVNQLGQINRYLELIRQSNDATRR